ncbi:MAG TPA: hypothetical protein VFE53_13550 [Mucilaginibacter sp.]|jgi:hypothetical protein|nr:hypothetical protein [Mucilaginibacter sp.]
MKKAWGYFRKYHLFFFLPLLVLSATIGPYVSSKSVQYTFVAIYTFSYYIDLQRGRTNIAERKAMARNGLTPKQVRNLNFVKKWDETRTTGRKKYVFVYGGLCFGFGLCFLFGLIAFTYIRGTADFVHKSPGNMFAIFVLCYFTGFITAVISHLILWAINEKKFARLNTAAH